MGKTERVSWLVTAWAAAVLAGLALSGCASSVAEHGIIRGQATLVGRVPLPGHPVEVAAISGGMVVMTMRISRSGGSFESAFPPGPTSSAY
jgi:hypothetical protein